jgi:hypothetical protein
MFVCQENSLLKKLKLHKGAVRAVEYDVEGKNILTGGKDKALKVGYDLDSLFTYCSLFDSYLKTCVTQTSENGEIEPEQGPNSDQWLCLSF